MNNPLFEWRLALRYLAGARGQGTFSLLSVLAILGNVLGVTALVVGQAIMAGIETRATNQLVRSDAHLWVYPVLDDREGARDVQANDLGLSAADAALLGITDGFSTAPPPQRTVDFNEALLRRLNDVEGIAAIHPLIELDVFSQLNGDFTLMQLRGASLGELQALGLRADQVPQPTHWGVIVPSGLLATQGIQVGDRLNLITAKLESTAIGRMPLTQDFRVIGTYPARSGAPLITSLATLQFLLEMDGKAGSIEIFATDPFDLGEVSRAVESAVGPGHQIETWDQRSDSAAAFIGVLRLVLLVVLGLIILVSAFNIFAGQLLLTDAQRRAIAVMRSFGTGQGAILRIFLYAGLIIGLFGAVFGLLLGLLLAYNFPLLTQLGVPGLGFFAQSPPIVRLGDLGFAFGLALILALIAAILPARSAARTSPIEAFSYG